MIYSDFKVEYISAIAYVPENRQSAFLDPDMSAQNNFLGNPNNAGKIRQIV